jgi:hypothetical protein
LNLKEWTIGLEWGRKKEMVDCVGCCLWQAEEQVAVIKLRKDHDGLSEEETLVHELLHIVLQGHDELGPQYSIPLERAINKIAKALTCQLES